MTESPTELELAGLPPPEGLPQSQALAEVELDSLAILMGRDPEGYSRQDRDRIIGALREQRARWEKAEADGASRKRVPKALRASEVLAMESPKSSGDVGL